MSSAVYLKFDKAIDRKSFDLFCSKNEIEFSPNTVGGNVYYYGGIGGVEIVFRESEITVSSFWGRNLLSIAHIAKKLRSEFGGIYDCDPELRCYMPPKYFVERE